MATNQQHDIELSVGMNLEDIDKGLREIGRKIGNSTQKFMGAASGLYHLKDNPLWQSYIHHIDVIRRATNLTTLNTEALAKWAGVAKAAGYSSEAVIGTMASLQQRLGGLTLGFGTDMLESFGMLGISMTKVNGQLKTSDELMNDLVQKAKSAKNKDTFAFLASRIGLSQDMVASIFQAAGDKNVENAPAINIEEKDVRWREEFFQKQTEVFNKFTESLHGPFGELIKFYNETVIPKLNEILDALGSGGSLVVGGAIGFGIVGYLRKMLGAATNTVGGARDWFRGIWAKWKGTTPVPGERSSLGISEEGFAEYLQEHDKWQAEVDEYNKNKANAKALEDKIKKWDKKYSTKSPGKKALANRQAWQQSLDKLNDALKNTPPEEPRPEKFIKSSKTLEILKHILNFFDKTGKGLMFMIIPGGDINNLPGMGGKADEWAALEFPNSVALNDFGTGRIMDGEQPINENSPGSGSISQTNNITVNVKGTDEASRFVAAYTDMHNATGLGPGMNIYNFNPPSMG